MKKIAKLIYSQIAAVIFFAPLAVFAQWTDPKGTNLPQSSVFDIIKTIMMWMLSILGFVAVIGFVISGIMYLVSAGDEEMQKKAKKAMIYSIVGVIVGLVGLVAIFAIQKMLGAQSF